MKKSLYWDFVTKIVLFSRQKHVLCTTLEQNLFPAKYYVGVFFFYTTKLLASSDELLADVLKKRPKIKKEHEGDGKDLVFGRNSKETQAAPPASRRRFSHFPRVLLVDVDFMFSLFRLKVN